jgi:hypothetical protein
MAFFAGSLLWGALRLLFPSGECLSCDRTSLTIGRIPELSLRGRWTYETFPIHEIEDLQFAAIRFSRYGSANGLRFTAGGRIKKVLAGIESPEAARILDALGALGVQVLHDPAMPMMVEMAISRRKR